MSRRLVSLLTFFLLGCSSMPGAVPYKKPSEEYLNMSGSIDPSLTYRVHVTYATRSASNACRQYHWTAGHHVSYSKEYYYAPRIDAEQHSIHIPLKELSPDTYCRWKAVAVSICAGPRDADAELDGCSSVFYISDDQHDGNEVLELKCQQGICFRQPFRLGTERVKHLNRSYVVNIFSAEQSQRDGPPEDPVLEVRDRIYKDARHKNNFTSLPKPTCSSKLAESHDE